MSVFGNYERMSAGHVLNSLHDYGIPLMIAEEVMFNSDGTINYRGHNFARYKYFDGIEKPLFYFNDRHWNDQPATSHDGQIVPLFRLNLSHHMTPGLTISGDLVTKHLWDFINHMMRESRMDHEEYKLRSAAGAFFQGGHAGPQDRFIYIEFWKPEGAQAFVDYINENYRGEIPNDKGVMYDKEKHISQITLDDVFDSEEEAKQFINKFSISALLSFQTKYCNGYGMYVSIDNVFTICEDGKIKVVYQFDSEYSGFDPEYVLGCINNYLRRQARLMKNKEE